MSRKTTRSGRRSGDARYGYRPSAETGRQSINFPHQIGERERQRRLDQINFDRLEKEWRSKRLESGREGWHDFGNKELPIDRYKHDIMKMVATNRVSLLAGETGSGKSTQLAQYALEMGYDRIVYLQPRRVITDNISERIEVELEGQFETKGLDMPESLVGMAHSERATLRDDSIIQVMTSGVFKKRAPELREQWVDEKVLLVADEVHEGNIETEFAIATGAELMTSQKNWDMVLMSATMNEAEIQEAYAPINSRKIPSITVEGRPHNIEQHQRAESNPVDVFFDECLPDGNKTLIFTDGKRSIKALTKEIEERAGDNKVRVLPLHSKIDDATRREIFYAKDDPEIHTVIISTSAGQSGLTISGVDRVISDGWTKSPELDAENASGLPRRLCSRAELTQQMGRGGRDVAGAKFFLTKAFVKASPAAQINNRFYSFESNKRDDHIPADIYNTVITRNVLSAAAMDKDFYTLNEYLIHKVTYETIKEAYSILRLIGAVDESNTVTDTGRQMDKLPLRPELARAVVESLADGQVATLQALAIAASIEAGGMARQDVDQAGDIEKLLVNQPKDDFMAELDLFLASRKMFDSNEESDEIYWAAGIDAVNAIRAHKQFNKMCHVLGIDQSVTDSLPNSRDQHDRNRLHDTFLLGMPHLLYEEVSRREHRGRRKKNPDGSKQPPEIDVWYRSVMAPDKYKPYTLDRQVGRRSVLASQLLPKDTIIAGYPRWFITDDGKIQNIIDKAFPTTRSAVKRALGRRAFDLRDEVKVDRDGRLSLETTAHIGHLEVRRTRRKDKAVSIDRVTALTEAALEQPGPAQREVRALKRRLEDLAERVPGKIRSYFFDKPPISDKDLVEMVKKAANGAGSVGELDANIRKSGIQSHHYISAEKWLAIEQNMPREIEIGGGIYDVNYIGDDATPVISGFPLSNTGNLPNRLTIRDGREVMFSFRYDSTENRLLTAEQVIRMSKPD